MDTINTATLTPQVMRGLQWMNEHFAFGGGNWPKGADRDDVAAAAAWLKAAKYGNASAV